MLRRAALLAVTFLVLTGLAGCSGGTKSGGTGTADLAELRGVVVDAAIRPLAGAEVALPTAARNATTGPDGTFLFDGLAPGAYALTVRKAGFLDAAMTVDAELGGSRVVNVQLEQAADAVAYAAAYVFEGFIDCGTGHFAACGAPFAAQTILCGNGGPCTDNVTDGRFIVFYTLDTVPDLIQSEVIWESNQPFGDSLVLIHFSSTPEQKAAFGGSEQNETVGPSPLMGGVTGEQARESGLGVNASLAIGIYPGKYCGVPGVCHENVGLVVQQRFRVITHAFFHYLPPPDWRFTTDGEAPPPA